jgi:hypothetical protein
VTEREKKGGAGERRGIIIVRLVKKGNANREEEEEGKKKKDNLGRSEGDETPGEKATSGVPGWEGKKEHVSLLEGRRGGIPHASSHVSSPSS